MASARTTLLLVDDDAIDRRAVQRFVQSERLPYDVVSVGSLAEAGSMLAHRVFDVALIGLRLGDGVGTELFPALAGTPTVMLVRSGDEAIAAQTPHPDAYALLVRDTGRRWLSLLAPTITAAFARRRAEIAAATRAEDLARTRAEFQCLASMMWREIMGPLTSLLGTIEMLQVETERDVPGSEGTATLVNAAVGTATHLERLVTDVLGYYRLQSPPTLVAVDLDAVVADVIAGLPFSAWHDVTIDAAALPRVSGDPARLLVLFRQLFDYVQQRRGPQPGMLDVWAVEYDDEVRVSLAEHGTYVQAAAPNLRADMALHADADEGLGMAICRRIAEQHGGRLWVEAHPGTGTTLHVTLPVATVRRKSAHDGEGAGVSP